MSYCRWSTNNFSCDLYCYEHVGGGFMTHVAGRRIKNIDEMPKTDASLISANRNEMDVQEALSSYMEQSNAQAKWLSVNVERVEIGLPHDWEAFHDPDLESFLRRLLYLKQVGYHFPDSVIDTVKEEIDDEQQGRREG